MFPKLAQMARDTYAVPATGSGVEREFSISGNIVNNQQNRLSPKTISDIMQYKRWMARTGVITKFLKSQEDVNTTDIEMRGQTESEEESEDEELNEDLIVWLKEWEKIRSLAERAKVLELVA
jgi:hypothetical protein